MESIHPNEFKIGRQSDESQGITPTESILFNPYDGIRYCNPHQGFTTIESTVLDGGNGWMKDDLLGIFRGFFITETVIKVDGGCEVWNVLRWQVSPEVETIIPTFIFINPRDCEGPSLHRETEFSVVANDLWVGYRVVMFKLHIYTVVIAFRNPYEKHGYRCNGWLHPDRRVCVGRVCVYPFEIALFVMIIS